MPAARYLLDDSSSVALLVHRTLTGQVASVADSVDGMKALLVVDDPAPDTVEGEVVSLLALLDKSLHGHTPSLFYTYKAFFLCKELGGELRPSSETQEAGFFSLQNLPPLSLQRVTPEELEMVFQRAALGLGAPSLFD